MWIKLGLDGIAFQLQISNYRLSKEDIWDEQWCRISCSIVDEKNKIINYHMSDDELLLCSEIEGLKTSIDKLLHDECTSKINVEFIEPDFELVLIPKSEAGYTTMEWKVHLWSDGLTANYFSIEFLEGELKYLSAYLKFIIGEYNCDTPIIKKMIESGILYG